ncbi:MAG: hypothetical protein BWY36_00909 [Candidatus Diapherotrites archaeon ADurb.Bin253]|nr:MAG: hypothetical protein BWY36_00909 [Candidatus Diapherotrites archaeon ADurb.Bin253]
MTVIKLVNGEKFVEFAIDGAEVTITQGKENTFEYEEGKFGDAELNVMNEVLKKVAKKIEAGFEYNDQESADALAEIEGTVEDFLMKREREKEEEKTRKALEKEEAKAKKELEKEEARKAREEEKARKKAEKEAEKAAMVDKSEEEIEDELDELD